MRLKEETDSSFRENVIVNGKMPFVIFQIKIIRLMQIANCAKLARLIGNWRGCKCVSRHSDNRWHRFGWLKWRTTRELTHPCNMSGVPVLQIVHCIKWKICKHQAETSPILHIVSYLFILKLKSFEAAPLGSDIVSLFYSEFQHLICNLNHHKKSLEIIASAFYQTKLCRFESGCESRLVIDLIRVFDLFLSY